MNMVTGTLKVETADPKITKAYGIYLDGRPSEMAIELAKLLPRKVTLPCGNFRWFSELHYEMLSDMPCRCGAPYEHYFIKWRRR